MAGNTLTHRTYDIVLAFDAASLVVNTPLPDFGGPASREAAIAFARHEAAVIGWPQVEVTRVAHTPSGGWTVSVRRA